MQGEDGITREALAAELNRICESVAFRHSHQHQQFLRHLIDCKLACRLAALREIALAIDFFRRPASTYDPKVDAVVRVEAGRLRQRLDRYYHGEGVGAPFEISMEKGSYLPTFRLRAPAATVAGAEPCVAVLALPAASAEPPDVQWAAALTDEIIQTLSRLPRVRVLRPESATAADVEAAPDDARAQLKVMWIVRGSWSASEPRLLALEIVGTADGKSLFTALLDPATTDALALHRRVRSEILHCLAELTGVRDGAESGAGFRHSTASPTRDLEAFDLYQRARYLVRQRDQAVVGKAIGYLESAVRVDPAFSMAWAELAGAYARRRQLVFDVAERDPRPAKHAAQRAIELDPNSGTAYAILAGLAYAAEFDWEKADRLFGRALAASPRDLDVRRAFATFLMFSARFDESLREYDVVQALDPIDPATRCDKGALYFYWRRYDRAETLLTQALEMTPHDIYALLLLADTYAQAGRAEESLEASRRMIDIAPTYANSHVYFARALRLLGRDAEALATMEHARARFAGSITDYEEAMLQIARGDAESTLACLARCALRKDNGAHCMVVDPTFARLHGDARWHAMLAHAGLPDFSARLEMGNLE
jgi:serine/threonine-protein kinase